MSKELLGKKELLDFLSELLSEVFEEQRNIRNQIQEYNEKIKKINEQVAEITNRENVGDSLFSPFAAKEKERKNECLLQIKNFQTNIFDLQDRMVYIQERIEKIKSLSIIVNKQTEDRLEEENNIFEKIRILETQEIERKRISMELHDTTVQNLTTLVHKTELCFKLIDIDMVRAKLEMQTMNDTLRKTINELREMIYQLRPMSIDDIGLVATLESMVKQKEMEEESIPISLRVINEEKNIIPVINLTLYRTIQEAYQNAKKYSKATEFIVTIIYEENEIQIILEDNGIGFDKKEIKDREEKNKHFGISIMKERIELLSGTIEFDSKKGEGTKIVIEVPIL